MVKAIRENPHYGVTAINSSPMTSSTSAAPMARGRGIRSDPDLADFASPKIVAIAPSAY